MRDLNGNVTVVEPKTVLQAAVGRAFIPHGTDSVGRVTRVTLGTVAFRYDHDPRVEWVVPARDFTSYFCRWVLDGAGS